MKVVSALRKRCKDCKIVRRGKKVYVKCSVFGKHKQRQGSFSTYYPFSAFTNTVQVPEIKIEPLDLLVMQQFASTVFRV
jgi:large subunit ribosomal protein L36